MLAVCCYVAELAEQVLLIYFSRGTNLFFAVNHRRLPA